MGVPRLFPFIINTFPKSVKHFRLGKFRTKVDYLLVDSNCLLHNACQQVYRYGADKSVVDQYEGMTPQQKHRAVCELYMSKLNEVISMITPQKVLHLTLDGSAPLAKQAQQRQRRYTAARTRSEEGTTAFDSSSISPGTTFMHEVTKYINYAIRCEFNCGKWHNFEVRFSPCTVAGEGEHKILTYIRSLSGKERSESTFCMFGPDGDLIMLTLSAHVPKMFLFREDVYQRDHFHYLDMGMIYRNIGEIFGTTAKSRKIRDMVNDFVFLGFFVGNDFLPKVQMFHLLEEGIECMLAMQSKLSEHSHRAGLRDYITVGGKVNPKGLRLFVKAVAENEKELLEAQKSFRPPAEQFKNNTLLRNLNVDGKLNWTEYRTDYYKKSSISSESEINDMCLDYIRTLAWILEYYIHGLPAWRWVYPWHYAPLMTDVAEMLATMTDSDIMELCKFQLDTPSLPFVQLLSILPPSSSDLVPYPYRSLFTSGKLIEKGYYPDPRIFPIDYEGRLKEYQGVSILPFVQYDDVAEAYKEIDADVRHKFPRNTFTKEVIYRYDEGYLSRYESEYGEIAICRVRKTEI